MHPLFSSLLTRPVLRRVLAVVLAWSAIVALFTLQLQFATETSWGDAFVISLFRWAQWMLVTPLIFWLTGKFPLSGPASLLRHGLYSEHAVKAFEVNAIDYLLKPVQAERMAAAISGVEALISKPAAGEDWQQRLFHALREADKSAFWSRIEIRSLGKTKLVPTEDVHWLKADGNYIEVHTAGKIHLARFTMSELEKHLDPQHFVRISRSSLVHLKYVAGFQSAGSRGHVVVLKDGNKLPATRSVTELQSFLKYLPA